ncbi:MAG TPA: 4a-hydroxytetrahydrobiopterin dehydratase [Elusimicrobiota bacterium]|nr:4a-hydroxytetrahydrobiopterin dehydratase [Elusimicrobiota bacterium]
MRKAEALARLRALPGWALAGGGKAIRRDYRLKDFLAAVSLIRRIAPLAQAMDHHPDLHLTGYRELKVVLTTHDAGGLTLLDFRLAAKIEALNAGKRGSAR